MKQKIQIRRPEDVAPCVAKWTRRRQEHFLALTLNGKHEIIRIHVVSIGLVNKTLVHPRESFFPVLKDFAVSVIFVHNHPSGNFEPSPEDLEVFDRLNMTGQLLQIPVLDHIITAKGLTEIWSYRERTEKPEYPRGAIVSIVGEYPAFNFTLRPADAGREKPASETGGAV